MTGTTPGAMTEEEKRQAEVEAWYTIYRLAVSQARTAARELERLGEKLSPPIIVKTPASRQPHLTKTEILIKM